MRLSAAVAVAALSLASFGSGAAPIQVADDLGRTVRLPQPPQRIVTLAPFLTELVFSAGAGGRLVAVSAFSDFPPEAKRLPQVATAAGLSLEEVAAMRPDLVLAWKDSVRLEDVERLGQLGIPTFVASARRLSDIPRVLRQVGELTGGKTEAQARGFEQRLAAVRSRYAGRARITVFLEIWHQPLTTLAGTHTLNDALEICGADNIFIDLATVAPVVSLEQLYLRDPRAIVGVASTRNEEAFRARWRERPTLAAVKGNRLVFGDADLLQRQTLRMAEGIERLCAAIDAVR